MPDRLVVVTWEDTTNIAAWQTRTEMEEWATATGWIAHNVGFLVYEDNHCVVVAARAVDDEEQHIGLAERIPKRAVLKIHDLDFNTCDIPGCEHLRSGRGYDMQPLGNDGSPDA
jgi:hypothetical protein